MKTFLRLTTILLGGVVIGLIGWRLGLHQRTAVVSPIPSYGKISDFNFRDQSGRAFGSENLKGKIWVADFIFTRCMGPCPMLTSRMAKLVERFKDSDRIQFVSFSVDPDFDSPAVLSRYAANYGARENQWHFLTGSKDKLYELIRTSFHLAVEPAQLKNPSNNDILHSLYFVLVDAQGNVVGYFNTDEEDAMKKLIEKINALAHA